MSECLNQDLQDGRINKIFKMETMDRQNDNELAYKNTYSGNINPENPIILLIMVQTIGKRLPETG